MRVLIQVSSTRNAFIEAWVLSLQRAGASVAIFFTGTDSPGDYPEAMARLTVGAGLPNAKKSLDSHTIAKVENVLQGEPEVIYYWWGLHALKDRRSQRAWPNAQLSLCVDTFPNASMWLSEIREIAYHQYALSSVGSFVVTSQQMADHLMKCIPLTRKAQFLPVLSPFPSTAHQVPPGGKSVPMSDDGGVHICFTGRSDFFFSDHARMRKDDISSYLLRMVAAGATVHVQEPSDRALEARLKAAGFRFYPRVSRTSLLSGDFSTMLGTFDAQYVGYRIANRTIGRRVSMGLSTRFALGLCSSAPQIAPPEASFARDVYRTFGIGFCPPSPEDSVRRLQAEGEAMRASWFEHHLSWRGERYGNELVNLWRNLQ